jgi:Ca2+-binding EF-hand superfamily protein
MTKNGPGDAERSRRKEWAALFALADGDGDGRVDFAEFRRLVGDLDPEPPMEPEALQVGFEEIDTDRDGRIDRDEFIA